MFGFAPLLERKQTSDDASTPSANFMGTTTPKAASNPGFLDYRIPVASDLPMIEPVLVEVPNPNHPYGAKGVAEVNICPPMAAIANAIEKAIGRRLTELPMSPPRVLAAIDGE